MSVKQIHPTYMDNDEMVGVCSTCKHPVFLYSYKLFNGKRYCRKCLGEEYTAISKARIEIAMNKAVNAIKGM